MSWLILSFGVFSVCLGLYVAGYGVKAGLIDQRIRANHRGGFLSGWRARIQGTFYLAIGLVMVAGGLLSILGAFARAA